MNIAIDARFLKGVRTGVGKYTHNLIHSIIRIGSNENFLLFVNDIPEKIQLHNVSFKKLQITIESHPQNEIWENVILPIYLRKNKIDVFHSPAFFLPLFLPGTKKIVTIHDLAVFRHPESFPYKFAKYFQFIVKTAVKNADRIIADSETVKLELMNILAVKGYKITVVYVGVDEGLVVNEREINSFRQTSGLTNGFILFAGTIEPRKNLVNLIKAFSILKERGFKQKLVIAGKRGWLYENIIEEARNCRYSDDIIFTGYVSDEELRHHYSSCDVFVYPSLYEGFGLPPLEAMACGAPVVVSDIPVFREVLGDSAFFVQAESPAPIADGVEKILTDAKLREKLIIAGREQVKRYSWEKTAIETLRVYKEVFDG